jgi:hypothetical protein
VQAQGFPLLAERLAIDVTVALRGAEAGLRALGGRMLLRRLWDQVTGEGGRLRGQVGSDLLAVQRAALDLLREILREEMRTQHCLRRVLVNLHEVNRELDAVAGGLHRVEGEVRQLRQELFEALRLEAARLAGQIDHLRREVRRETRLRELTELYRVDQLHPGAGPTLEAGLFLAAVQAECWQSEGEGEGEEERAWADASQRRIAEALVRARVSSRPLPLEQAMLETAEAAAPELREPLVYLGQGRGPHLAVLGALLERRLAGLANGEVNASDTVAVVRATGDGAGRLQSRLVRPVELALAIAHELAPEAEELA